MKISKLLALLIAAMLVVVGCGQQDEEAMQPDPEPTMAPEAGTAETPEAPAEAAAEQTYDQVGISVALPAGWEETTAPEDMNMGDSPSVAFKQTGQEYPLVVVSGMDKDMYGTVQQGFATKGEDSLKAMADGIKEAIVSTEGGSKAGTVLSEEEWSGAEGITKGWKARVQGMDEKLGKEVTGDIYVAEATAGGLYIMMVQALDAAGVDQAQPLVDAIRFTTPPAPAANGAAGEGAAPETAGETPTDAPAPSGE